VNHVDAMSLRAQTGADTALAPSSPLIHVTWDSGADLGQFLSFISNYSKGRFSGRLAERVALASTELLDNAIRYGSLARDFSYRLSLAGSAIAVSVQNTTVRARIDMLTAQLRRLDTAPDQVYSSELERSMTNSGGRRSMLGLARIRHEAEMTLQLEVDINEVTVRAVCKR
jgi:hypothetical protein